MRRRLSAAGALALALGVMAPAGCSQGVGERCEITADCADGLFCMNSTAASSGGGMGTCQPFGTTNGGTDAAPATDGAPDVASDAGATADGASDAATAADGATSADDGGADGAPGDAVD